MKTLNLENIFTAAFPVGEPNAIQQWLLDELAYPTEFDSVRNLIRHLDMASCASGSWSGLIYTSDIESKLADSEWRDAIDSALEEYSDETGESYAPQAPNALEELVRFAVDHYASDLAHRLQHEADGEGVYIVTIAQDSLDPSPEHIAFFGEAEALEYAQDSVDQRLQLAGPEENLEELEEVEWQLIKVEAE
jgi:hypothetical protein